MCSTVGLYLHAHLSIGTRLIFIIQTINLQAAKSVGLQHEGINSSLDLPVMPNLDRDSKFGSSPWKSNALTLAHHTNMLRIR